MLDGKTIEKSERILAAQEYSNILSSLCEQNFKSSTTLNDIPQAGEDVVPKEYALLIQH
jgi:hypothetical protein